jgi:hypothetical protein
MSDAAFESIFEMLASPNHDDLEKLFILLETALANVDLLCEQTLRIVQFFSRQTAALPFDWIDDIANPPIRVRVTAMLLMRTIDVEHRSVILRSLPERECHLVRQRLHDFDILNPTAHYRLDLSVKIERSIAIRLSDISEMQRQKNEKLGKFDLSQSGNGQAWRNETLNGVPFVFEPTWSFPKMGVLE